MKKILMAAAATVLASGMAFAQTSSGTVPGTGAPQTGVSPMSPTGNSNATSATQGMTSSGGGTAATPPRVQGTDVTGSGGAGGGSNSTGSGNGAGAGAGTSK